MDQSTYLKYDWYTASELVHYISSNIIYIPLKTKIKVSE